MMSAKFAEEREVGETKCAVEEYSIRTVVNHERTIPWHSSQTDLPLVQSMGNASHLRRPSKKSWDDK